MHQIHNQPNPSTRLNGDALFQHIFDQRIRAYDRRLTIFVAANGLEQSRLGIRVGRHIGNAVIRSKVRRRIRDAFRLNYAIMPHGMDIICIARAGDQLTYHAISESFIRLAKICNQKQQKRTV